MRIAEKGRRVKVYYIDANMLWRILRGKARITNMPPKFSSMLYAQWNMSRASFGFLVECEDFPIAEQGAECDTVMAQYEMLPVHKEATSNADNGA